MNMRLFVVDNKASCAKNQRWNRYWAAFSIAAYVVKCSLSQPTINGALLYR